MQIPKQRKGVYTMAKKVQSFKIDEKKKAIIIYTNVESTAAEESLKLFYLNNGYKPLVDEKKKGITVDEMIEHLQEDEEALKKFEELYSCKDKTAIKEKKAGFHAACKFYNAWKKENK